jgi:F-type H+-transporting ATPase subunit a
VLTTTINLAAEDDGFHPPSLADFFPPAILFEGTIFEFTRVNMIQLIMTITVATFFILAFRNPQVVPRGIQNLGEIAVNFVQSYVIDAIMGASGRRYLPYLVTLFFFILAFNMAGLIPFMNLPGSSVVAVPMLMAIVAWVTFNTAGIYKHGFGHYMKANLFPPGVPKVVYVLLTPVEFLSTFILRPLTLTIRLLANMMAGHLMLVLFFSGATYLFLDAEWLLKPFGLGAAAMGFFITALKLLISFLQAYIFTLLTALYIAGAESESH